MTKKVILTKGREAAVKRGHPWIFSGAIGRKPESVKQGDIVTVYDHRENFLCTGFWQSESIAVKILSHKPVDLNLHFWVDKLSAAKRLREKIGYLPGGASNSFRLVNGEGDHLPGLIIDYYNGHFVAQLHSNAYEAFRELIEQALKQTFPELQYIYFQRTYSNEPEPESAGAAVPSAIIMEHGLQYVVNWAEGQKTGFFLDQRENRLLLRQYVESQKVLNAYAYSGGFSLNALTGGASEVVSVDTSKAAIGWLEENLKLNNFGSNHTSITGDTYQYLAGTKDQFDTIILDPPAFAKHFDARHRALKGYQKINKMAFEKIKPDGTLFTFSCSNVVTSELFEGAVRAAAIDAGRQVQVLHHLSQAPDHPVNLMHPEGGYLKGLVVHVE